MAKLGLKQKFNAFHGSKTKRKDTYTVELIIEGNIEQGFVAGVDYLVPKRRLSALINKFEHNYLDDIVGRATNENIAEYILHSFLDLPVTSVRLEEGDFDYVEVYRSEFDSENYDVQLLCNRGYSFLLRENPEKAKSFFSKAIIKNNSFAEAYNLRGRCFRYLNDWNLALDDFNTAIAINSNFGEAWRNKGNALLYLGKYDEMEDSFNMAVSLQPTSALTINNRGFGFFITKQYDLALKDHELAIQLDPNYAEAHYDKAMALKYLGSRSDAIKELLISRKLKQTSKDTYHNVKMY